MNSSFSLFDPLSTTDNQKSSKGKGKKRDEAKNNNHVVTKPPEDDKIDDKEWAELEAGRHQQTISPPKKKTEAEQDENLNLELTAMGASATEWLGMETELEVPMPEL